MVALNYSTGAIRWSRALPSQSESSPLVDHGKIFFGSQNGTVYALNAHNGRPYLDLPRRRRRQGQPDARRTACSTSATTPGTCRRSPSRPGGGCGSRGSEGALLGSGTFYSTAAVVYGRVFLGNTDGRVYAYDASTGKLDWAVQTGAYVYASPAVTNAPGLGPTIYLGSYDGTFYALNARSGQIAWKYNAHGRISGSATIIGRTVYFSDLGNTAPTVSASRPAASSSSWPPAPSIRRSATAKTSTSPATPASTHSPPGAFESTPKARMPNREARHYAHSPGRVSHHIGPAARALR